MPTSPLVSKRELSDAVESGRVVGNISASPRRVHAALIRETLRELDRPLGGAGLRLENVRIAGKLDLSDFTVPIPICLHNCVLTAELLADRATLHRIELVDCEAEHVSLEELVSPHSVVLNSLTTRSGGISLLLGRIQGDLDIRGTTLVPPGGIQLDSLDIAGSILANGLSVSTTRQSAAVSLNHVRVKSEVSFSGASIDNSAGVALSARYAQIKGGFDLSGVTVSTDSVEPAIDLNRSHVEGNVSIEEVNISNKSGTAIRAINASIGQGLLIEGKSTFSGRGGSGTLRLIGAEVGGQVVIAGVGIKNERGPAIIASGLAVASGLFLQHTTCSVKSTAQAIDLKGLKCGGTLDIRRVAIISLGTGIALDQSTISGSLIAKRLAIQGRGSNGALRLIGSHITGQATFETCRFVNPDGPGVVADGLDVGTDLVYAASSEFICDYPGGALRLLGSRVGGQFSFTRSKLSNHGGSGINLQGAQTDGGVLLENSFLEALNETFRFLSASCGGDLYIQGCTIKTPKGSGGTALLLQGSTVKRALRLKLSDLVTRSRPTKLFVDFEGCTYGNTSTDDSSIDTWLIVLRNHTTRFAGQPYQQLAKVLRESGRATDARRVLVQHEKDRREVGANMPKTESNWHRLLGSVIGYGYKPQKAVLPFLGTVAITAALIVGLCAYDPSTLTRLDGSNRFPCGLIEQLSFTGDAAIPLIGAGFRFQQCSLAPTPLGQLAVAATTVLRFASWALVTLFVAGLAGLVKKD